MNEMKFFGSLILLFIISSLVDSKRPKKSDRYGYDSYGGDSYDSYGGEFGDLLSEYSSDYGLHLDAYGGGGGGDHFGSYGGGYGGYAPIYETEYSGGYGKMKSSYKKPNMRSGYMSSYGSYKPKIQFKKSYEMLGLYGKGSGKQYQVRVPQDDSPVKVMFLTQNTPVHIQQKHKKGQPEYKKATTHEEPHVVVHEVIKPVIQEIREIIVPYRKVIQKIEPVQEERKTIVHKDNDGDKDGGYGGGSGGDKYKTSSYEDNDKYKSSSYQEKDKYEKYQESSKYQDNSKYQDDDKYKYRASEEREVKTSYKRPTNYDSLDSLDEKYRESRVVSTSLNGGHLGNTGLTLAAIFGPKNEEQSKSS